MPLQVTVSQEAAERSIGHALKHPLKVVAGVLLGQRETESSSYVISDVIPLSHNTFVGTPITVSLAMIEEYAKQLQKEGDRQPQSLLGLYFYPITDAIEVGQKNSLEHACLRSVSGVLANEVGECLVLKGDIGTLTWKAIILKPGQTEWSEKEVFSVSLSEGVKQTVISETIKGQGYLKINDMEEFLTESSLCPV